MGLAPNDLKWVMYVRGNFMPLGERRKYFGRNRLRDGPYSCSMCGEMDESLHHFSRDFRELRELRLERFGRKVGGRDWILEMLRSRCYLSIDYIGKFVRVGMRYRDVYLNNLFNVFSVYVCCCIFFTCLCMSPWPTGAFV